MKCFRCDMIYLKQDHHALESTVDDQMCYSCNKQLLEELEQEMKEIDDRDEEC